MPISSSVLFARLTATARLKHLQLLQYTAELSSLQRAASAVGMSQPAATHALARLESLIGAPLFERHSRGMRPTAAGRAVLPPLRAALRAMQDCAEAVAATQMGTVGSIKLGTIGAGVSGLLQQVLPSLSEQQPRLAFDILQLEADDLFGHWERHELDLILCRPPAQCPGDTRFLPLVSDRYCVVTRPTHPLANTANVSVDQLHACTWLMPPPRTIASRDFYKLWEDCASNPNQRWVNSRSQLLLLAMHQQQELLSFIPYNMVRPLIDNGLLKEIDCTVGGPLPSIGVLYRVDDPASNPGLTTLLDALVAAGDLASPGAWR